MDIEVKGDIISDDYAWIYDWLGYNYASPSKIINQIKEANGEELNIKVNSPGGDVFAASDIYTELRNYKGNVNINITGLAASAASVISMARHSSMSPTAQLMVHNVSSYASGDYRDMDHMSEVLKNANNTIANAYMCKSGMSREQALEIMNNETWLT
ncbi:head maturation protease, ClpP-related, partial [Clostridium beijerinckii]